MKRHVTKMVRIGVVLLMVFMFRVSRMVMSEKKPIPVETSPVNESGYVSDGGEVEPLVQAEPGDPGIEDEGELTILSEITVEVSGQSSEDMLAFVYQYLGYIPFADGGRFYGTGYFKAPDGVDNRIQEPVGMDSLGYVIWLYRNVFGICSEDFENPIILYGNSQKVKIEDLKVGDIGMYTDQLGVPNHFGVFVGYDHGIPVFAHCAGIAVPKYPCGNDRLSFLRAAVEDYYMGNAPVELNFFFRPEVPWTDNEKGGEE